MSGTSIADLSGLVALAQHRELDLRPIILRVQTDLFVGAQGRDRAMVEAFEALACGLLPTVDDETAALVAAKLAPLEDTPEDVLRCLARRGGEALRLVLELSVRLTAPLLEIASSRGSEINAAMAARSGLTHGAIQDLVRLERDAVDLALARNPSIVLRGSALHTLIERARAWGDLAKALSERPEVSLVETAALYLHADETRRKELLAAVEAIAAMRKPSLPQPDAADRAALVARAGARDAALFGDWLAAMLALPEVPDWRFDEPARHDLLALALLAAGVPEEESIRILLTLEPSIAVKVDTVLRLVRLFRKTPREVAAFILEAVLGCPVGAKAAGQHRPHLEPGGTPSRAVAITLSRGRDEFRDARRPQASA